jgi:hypothetical protein
MTARSGNRDVVFFARAAPVSRARPQFDEALKSLEDAHRLQGIG